MTIAIDIPQRRTLPAGVRLPGIAVAAVASIGAGAIHAAAAGVHAEHPQLARLFVLCSVFQLGTGLWALVQPRRLAAVALAGVNAIAVGGWLITRIAGVSWIDGLQEREAAQFADASCAILGAIAVGTALAAVLVGWHPGRTQRLFLPGFAAAAIAIPAMLTAGTHVHSHDTSSAASGDGSAHVHSADEAGAPTAAGGDSGGSGAGAGAAAGATETTAHTHDHGTQTTTPAGGANSTETTVHDHGAGGGDAIATAGGDGSATEPSVHNHGGGSEAPVAANWPRPWDPTKPIDLSGVANVTAEEQARATKLVEDTLLDLPKWADTAAAIADGYTSIGDAGTGSEHYIKLSIIQDDVILDPTQPESLVYTVDGDKRTLAGAMFITSARATDDPSLTSWAGPLMQWHNHGNLCWDRDASGVAKVVGIVEADGKCASGVNTGGANPMVHVWIVPHPCGVFAALEGVGAGQATVPDDQRVDMCNQQHEHGATPEPAAVPTVAYDPTKPIDLGGVAGVTPEQQAAAENLVAVTVVRLPQWADYKVAEAAGFHSIGDALTGHEHYINWDWINDDVTLDPDHPESLVYVPQPDGSKLLVSVMYMLPDTVTLDQVPNIGGALMQWHIHDNLCFTTDPVAPRVSGVTTSQGGCPVGQQKFPPAPMIHVWITPNACGPFAALEGVGAGQVLAGQDHLCDHVHGDGLF